MGVIEDLRRLREADAMLLLVLPSLLGVPFEYQHRVSNSNLSPSFGALKEARYHSADA